MNRTDTRLPTAFMVGSFKSAKIWSRIFFLVVLSASMTGLSPPKLKRIGLTSSFESVRLL